MKKTIFTMAATAVIAGILLTSCNSSSQKIENAEEKVLETKEAVIEAQIDLKQAQHDSITDFRQSKSEYQNQISANEKSIAELKSSFLIESQENKALYEKKLAKLEDKNKDLKIKLAEHKEDGTDK